MDAESREVEIAVDAEAALAAAGKLKVRETGRTIPIIPGVIFRLAGGSQWMVSADATHFVEVTAGYKEVQ
jgi:hypothetical protein